MVRGQRFECGIGLEVLESVTLKPQSSGVPVWCECGAREV